MRCSHFLKILLVLAVAPVPIAAVGAAGSLPEFGKDTVLVWKIQNQNFQGEFVVRIAEFAPDRFIEWEDENSQGTIFMPRKDLLTATRFLSTNLFSAGMDTHAEGATTLWLSRKIFQELKDRKKIKCNLDGVPGRLTYEGNGEIEIEANRQPLTFPVIKVSDDRGSERWFLDHEDNALMVRQAVRTFTQVLASITTDRPNTLRWIKGKKLENLPK
jgi:hypothetical protein